MELALVVRVQLYRSLRSKMRADSDVSLEVMYASEFCDAVQPSVAADHDLVATFVCHDGDGAANEAVLCESVCAKEHTTVYRVRFPATPGRYQLLLQPRLRHPSSPFSFSSSSAVHVLPLLTEAFDVVPDAAGLANTLPLLTCFRPVAGLTVREEYGHTIGSHIYDSSVVMLRFLSACLDAHRGDGSDVAPSSSSTFGFVPSAAAAAAVASVGPSDTVLELGAGCGLVSLWMARHLPGRVVATDLERQLPFLRDNIARNAHAGAASLPTVAGLDWTDLRGALDAAAAAAATSTSSPLAREAARRAFQQEHMGVSAAEDFALVVACDVLYDRALAADFFEAVRAFSRPPPGRTSLLIAQKMRNHASAGGAGDAPAGPPAFDVAQVAGFACRKAWEEANVVVWEMWREH